MSSPAVSGNILTVASSGCCGGSSPASASPNDSREIKKLVKEYYGNAVQREQKGCCTKSASAAASIPDLAGYDAQTLAAVPPEAAEKSFGCGDPLAFAQVQSGQTVLDLGSGAGIDCFIAAQKVGPTGRVIGLDMTPAMLEAARRNVEKGGYTNVEFRQGEAENMPVESNSVDWVISNCVINLSPDKPRVFQEILRVLKPGGHISISDIVAEELPAAFRNDAGSYCGCVGGAITTNEYLRGLAQAGLVDVRIDARLDYTPEMIKGFVEGDDNLSRQYGGVVAGDPAVLERVKIASVKVVGRKPLPDEEIRIDLRSARESDFAAIAQLLAENNLPDNGLWQALPNTLLAEHNRHVIGVFAFERYGANALLRSYVVAPAWRGRGIGRSLWQELLGRARRQGVTTFYLLTNTIAEMAERAGFERISRDDVPAPVRSSAEFSLNCCSSAAIMRMAVPA
ncbi:MAG: arsenite methyltransferase [bacterium]